MAIKKCFNLNPVIHHLHYRNEMLNMKVPWQEIAKTIFDHGYEKQKIALTIGLSEAAINFVLQGNYDDLFFRA